MLRAGHVIVICTLALLTLGVVMVNSAGMNVDPNATVTLKSLLLSRSTIYMGLAIFAMIVVSLLAPVHWFAGIGRFDTASRSPWSLPFLWFGVLAILAILAIVYVPGVGSERKGAHRWINLQLPGVGDLSVQPSEIAKWGLVVLIAWYAATVGPRLSRFWHGLVPALVVIAAVGAFVAIEDLGTAVLIGVTAVLILLAGGASLWHFAAMIPLAVAGFVTAVIAEPYRLARITAFMDPYAEPTKSGYHMIQSMVAVSNGEVWGRGLGHGLQKFGYLPEDTTDFLFAIICEELGVFGAALVIALYAGLLFAGLAIVRRQTAPMLKLVALGIVTTIGLQAIINLAVVTGLGPTKGIALPLLSSGGTGWLLTASSLGLLVAIDRFSARESGAPETVADIPAAKPSASPDATGGVPPNVARFGSVAR